MQRQVSIEIFSPTEGIHTELSPSMMTPRSTPNAQNAISAYGVIKKDYGTSLHSSRQVGQLTWDTYTKLLLHCDGTDESTTFTDEIGKTVTANGDAQIDTAQKKFGTGSALFDGTGDYLSLADSDDWDFGTGDFTIDFQVSYAALPSVDDTYYCLFMNDSFADGVAIYLYRQNSTTYKLDCYAKGVDTAYTITTPVVDTWYHIAFVRVSGIITAYINGTATGAGVSATGNITGLTGGIAVGANISAGQLLNGHIDELCVFNGKALWTGNFTAPTYACGQVYIDTATKKFGTGSAQFSGGGGVLTLADSDDWDFGTGDFTVEFFIRVPALTAYGGVEQFTDSNNYWGLYIYDTGIRFRAVSGGVAHSGLTAGHGISANTWAHFAIVRNGNVWTIYVDGVAKATSTEDFTMPALSDVLRVGTYFETLQSITGNIDQVRILKGVARWTAAFTPPTFEYSTINDLFAGSKLVYRGWVAGITPVLDDAQSVTLDIRGYFDRLNNLIIQDTGGKKAYSADLVSDIVDDIVDTFVTPNTPITKGTIDASDFTADTLEFKCSIIEALKTLADLEGGVEYGVDEDLIFFWRDIDSSITHRFFVGNNIKMFEKRYDYSKIVNRIYLEGGDVADVPYAYMLENTDSQDTYFLSEQIITNGSITTSSVADQYLTQKLNQVSGPVLNVRVKIVNTDIRIEDVVPLGTISVYDSGSAKLMEQSESIWGKTVSGGSNLIWGKAGASGSDAIWGGTFAGQIDKISYTLSDSDDRFNIELTVGGTAMEAAAKIKQLEMMFNEIRQRSAA